jgi:hypothetical protein
MKRIPTTTNGKVIARIMRRLIPTEKWFLLWFSIKTNGLIPRPIIRKIIPPIISHFQETIRITSKTKEGIRCNKKAVSCCQMVRPGAKESRANMLTKRIARIQIIRGSQ